MVFVGPSPKNIEEFGLKHRARELAQAAGVPLVPGTDMITSQEEAAKEAQRLGYPVSTYSCIVIFSLMRRCR